MKKWNGWIKPISIIGLSFVVAMGLSGCSSLSKVNVFKNKKAKTLPPTPLKAINTSLSANVAWQVSTGGFSKSEYVKIHPSIDRHYIYVAGGSVISAWDKRSGGSLWKSPVANTVTGGIGIGQSTVFLGTGNGNAIALDKGTGKPRWVQSLSSEILAVSDEAMGMVVFRTTDGKLHGVSVATGEIIWQQSRKPPLLTLRGTSVPIVSDNKVIVGFDDGRVLAFDIADGRQIWEAILAVPRGRTDLDRIVDIDGKMQLVGSSLYAASYHGQLAAINVHSGAIQWSKGFSTDSGVAADRENIYTANDQGDVFRVMASNGNPFWKMNDLVRRQPTAPSIVASRNIVMGDFAGYLHFVNAINGQLVARVRGDAAGYTVSPLVDGNTVYAFGKKGVLTAVVVK